MSEVYNKCIMAPSASECASLLKQCAKGDKGCIDTFNKLGGKIIFAAKALHR